MAMLIQVMWVCNCGTTVTKTVEVQPGYIGISEIPEGWKDHNTCDVCAAKVS